MKQLLATVCREAGVGAPLEAPPGVEVVQRKTGEASYLVFLNHGAHPAKVHIDKPARDLLAGGEHRGTLTLEPLGVAVLQEAG